MNEIIKEGNDVLIEIEANIDVVSKENSLYIFIISDKVGQMEATYWDIDGAFPVTLPKYGKLVGQLKDGSAKKFNCFHIKAL